MVVFLACLLFLIFSCMTNLTILASSTMKALVILLPQSKQTKWRKSLNRVPLFELRWSQNSSIGSWNSSLASWDGFVLSWAESGNSSNFFPAQGRDVSLWSSGLFLDVLSDNATTCEFLNGMHVHSRKKQGRGYLESWLSWFCCCGCCRTFFFCKWVWQTFYSRNQLMIGKKLLLIWKSQNQTDLGIKTCWKES